MKDQVFRVEYFALTVEDRPGVGAELGRRLKDEGVNLLAMSAFPLAAGKTQVDIIPEHPDQLAKAARSMKLTLGEPKAAFLVQGTDRAGAMGEVLNRLGAANINVRASLGVAGGGNRYGALLWVDQQDVELAARALGATTMATHHV
jgi:predicted amino acid-binding ACT domain protein